MLDFSTLYATLRDQLAVLDKNQTLMVGVHTGGYWLAEKLHTDLAFTLPLAALSTTLQRDDFATAGLHKQKQPTRLPMSLQGVHVLLVDDVLHTGRSVRAAINELFEYGRPASVQLAVLADRGGRELPLSADFCGGAVALLPTQALALNKNDMGLDLHIEVRA